MSRLIGLLLAASVGAALVVLFARRAREVASSGNGHAADEERIEMLRERIAAARRRLRDEIDSVRGE